MNVIANLLLALVAVSHLWFLTLEMFLWQRPTGLATFGMTPEQAAATAVLAGNQGLYNGFLAAGLLWALASGRRDLKRFFLGCVVIAGVYGALTAKVTILFVQALPAVLAWVCGEMAGRRNRLG